MVSTFKNDKKGFFRRNRDLVLAFLVLTPLFYVYIFTQPVSPFLPREAPYAPYERHHRPSLHFPFVTSYFLMEPQNYQPDKFIYPLVLMLHGASAHMYGGKVLARPEMRAWFPAFVVIPIAPFGAVWAMPDKGSFRPQALSLAIDAVKSVAAEYNIDPNRIYVTGYSMGGIGTYGAIARYPGLFAAAVPTDGTWSPERAAELDDIPLWIFHGAQDSAIPASGDRAIAAILSQTRNNVFYTEFPRQGHGAWVPAYESPELWSWLFDKRRE